MTYNMSRELKHLISESLREQEDSYIIQQLFNQFPTKTELLSATEQQLITVKGIGVGKARQIIAMLKLAKAIAAPVENPAAIRSPQDVFDLLSAEYKHATKENFICLFLNTKNRLIFKEVISVGNLNSAIVHPREVFQAAIKRCSASLICAHNHPSGDPEPSFEDIKLTKRLADAGKIIGIEVLDHVVIGDHQFYSLKEHGHI